MKYKNAFAITDIDNKLGVLVIRQEFLDSFEPYSPIEVFRILDETVYTDWGTTVEPCIADLSSVYRNEELSLVLSDMETNTTKLEGMAFKIFKIANSSTLQNIELLINILNSYSEQEETTNSGIKIIG